ncbi:hypothetical protein PUNSTDRAFT_124608 [Punctularia strigosozonata HHB-11173 SS5]|uniref:uncharacterized protein n=1 Tax=Punctularia strigosozonata (strain HHB-11173) TaxID=741275 RepID=UPI0004417A01|nr:uncharacterized protein PUNSTDRAFT_124608 [Punctularia strigosozonata HHB-11173 SS5]EIN13044.1 hypothetical protein PUNSTDRAFT_124608 [Punctularia strigosozonata HHB-11173 SS5]
MATMASLSPPPLELLPAYSASITRPAPSALRPRQPEVVERKFPLAQIRKEPWAYLIVRSRGGSSNDRPQYFQGEDVQGSVEMDVPKGDTAIRSVEVSVRGHLVSGPSPRSPNAAKTTFLNISRVLWSGDKLSGVNRWDFTLKLPTECGIDAENEDPQQKWPLPPSFMEQEARFGIHYEIFLHVRRGLLRGDSRLNITFNYSPLVFPEAPSALRQLAYRENIAHLIGPSGDPHGWKALPLIKMQGTVFSSRLIEANCILSLATPLCYTRSTVIPLRLTIQTDDAQSLHLLSTTKAPIVRLMRHSSNYTKIAANTPDNLITSPDDFNTESRIVDTAIWWPANEGDTPPNSRTLNGELRVPGNLKPACIFGFAKISYAVVLQPFRAIAFSPSAKPREYLASQPIEIATAFPLGPRPRSMAPPAYS